MRRRIGVAISGATAAIMGLLPHVLHHAGPLAGAALFAGVGGSLLFGALGLVAAVPFLLRVHRRHGGWRRPGALLALFAVMFSISTFVVGPAISGDDSKSDASPAITRTQPADSEPREHEEHHP